MLLKRLAALATFVLPSAFAAAPSGTAADYGKEVSAPATRIVVLAENTRHVNVVNGETVLFRAGAASFTWHFDTYTNASAVALERLAPQGFPAGAVAVHIEQSQHYRG